MKQIRGRPMASRTMLITGGTAGIGKATALGLATMGAHIAITGRDRDRDSADAAAAEIRAAGGGLEHPAPDGRRARAHIRPQPPRAVPAALQ